MKLNRSLRGLFVLIAVILLGLYGTQISAATAQNRVPRFGAGECTFTPRSVPDGIKLECGHLVVAQDRKKPAAKTFRLAVAIVRAGPKSSLPPLVMLHGGPSGPGGITAGEMSGAIRWGPMLKRDIIVYDQRGVGLSEPKLCPTRTPPGVKVLNVKTPQERQEIFNASTRECVAMMKADGIDPDMFNSEVNAADLIDLRKTLGYVKWDLAGVSYGGRLVQEAMRRDPKGIRSVVMHSPSIVGAGAESDLPLSYQRVLERVFAACKAQAACSTKFPTFEQDFYEVYGELNKQPLDVTIERSDGTVTIRFDGERFLRAIHNGFSGRLRRLPLLVNELKRGDRPRVARFLLAGSATGTGSNVLTDLVGCYDGYGPDYLKTIAAIRSQVRPEFRIFVNDLQECPIWHTRFASKSDHALVRSDIPALILTTEFDDRTPTVHGRRIAGALKRAYIFELPGQGHGQSPIGCPQTIIFHFLKDPNHKPDDSCIATMPAIAFETKNLEVPAVKFAITSADQGGIPFVGTWDAAFPNAPVVYLFDLKVEGAEVSGTLGASVQKLQIFDGRIEGQTMTFKVKSPDGDRIITFTGKLSGNEILFIREVEVRPGGSPGGAALFGASGVRTFTARRIE